MEFDISVYCLANEATLENMKYSDLLISKVIKAKYFRDDSIFTLAQKSSGSYAWKSLCSEIYRGIEYTPHTVKMEKTGEYSVKEGSYEWKVAQTSNQGKPSNRDEMQKKRNKLWRLRLPDRVKIHVWRLIHEALPTNNRLQRQGCDIINECKMCGYIDESLVHL